MCKVIPIGPDVARLNATREGLAAHAKAIGANAAELQNAKAEARRLMARGTSAAAAFAAAKSIFRRHPVREDFPRPAA